MRYYPIHIDLKMKPVLLVGGGSVAHQKIEGLLQAGASITVRAPKICQSIERLASENKVVIQKEVYQSGLVKSFYMVFGATNSNEVNRYLHQECLEHRILFNAVDQPDECDFIIPARVARGDFVLTISTGGQAPFLSKYFREKLERAFGEETDRWVKAWGGIRQQLLKENKKEKLMPLFQKWGDVLRQAMRRGDESHVQQILSEIEASL